MIGSIPSGEFECAINRLVADVSRTDALEKLGLSEEEISDVSALIPGLHPARSPDAFLDDPFKTKPYLKIGKTRFSDGTIRVFYSAIEPETAQDEIAYWYAKSLFSGSIPRKVFYRTLTCSFAGSVKNLRPYEASMPHLVADDGYDACNAIGKEAVSCKLDGLLTPSARRKNGTCLPVFRRECLSNGTLGHWFLFTYDPSSRPKITVKKT